MILVKVAQLENLRQGLFILLLLQQMNDVLEANNAAEQLGRQSLL
ncbi:hypothetical protein [Paenibacillus stellifer]|nr:hypothetical protein [Paenibacillus stellifer]